MLLLADRETTFWDYSKPDALKEDLLRLRHAGQVKNACLICQVNCYLTFGTSKQDKAGTCADGISS